MQETPPWYQYPDPTTWENISDAQRARSTRILSALEDKRVPVLPYPQVVTDDAKVDLQPPAEVTKRLMVLWAIALHASNAEVEITRGIIEALDLQSTLSQDEERFLSQNPPHPAMAQAMEWDLECIWVFLWAIGRLEDLPWPGQMCDVKFIADSLKQHESDLDFIHGQTLISTSQILDELELTMRLHWAIRNAMMYQEGIIPEDLNWDGDAEFVHATRAASVGVIEKRHRALRWLTDASNETDWDRVNTPT